MVNKKAFTFIEFILYIVILFIPLLVLFYTLKWNDCSSWFTEITLSNWQTWSCINLWATSVWDWEKKLKDCNWSKENCNKYNWLWNYYKWWSSDIPSKDLISLLPKSYSWNLDFNDMWWWYSDLSTKITWWRVNSVNKLLMKWNCPTWWHIPTYYEWLLACDNIMWKMCDDSMLTDPTFLSRLRLPFNWFYSESIGYRGQWVDFSYWSSTPWEYISYSSKYNTKIIWWKGDLVKDLAFNIRCLKN